MLKKSLILLLVSIMLSCGGGGGSDDSSALSNNACGLLGLNTRIIDGTSCANPSSAPVVRVILEINSFSTSFCSGSFIAPNKVLTAAHCFVEAPRRTFVFVGDTLNSSTSYRATRVAVHPNLASGNNTLIRDVAIITLGQNVNISTLPILVRSAPSTGDIGSIYGYGADRSGTTSFDNLVSGQMRVSEVTVSNIRADFNGEGSNTCLGDSGGPIVISVDGRAAIAGLTSTGIRTDCLEGDQSYFTNIQDPDVLSFIKQNAPGAEYW